MIQLPFGVAIPFVLLRHREVPTHTDRRGDTGTRTSLRPALSHPVFWLLTLSFVSFAFTFTSLVFHLVPMLREIGYTTAEAVAAYAIIGPAQLAGRVAVFTLERFMSLTTAGLIGTLFPVIAVSTLIILEPHSALVFVFAVAFGTGMGIKTIVQATAAPEFLGREAYGALQGALMLPVYLAQAGSPLAAAWIWQLRGNYDLLQVALLISAATSAVTFVLAARRRPVASVSPRR